MDYYHQVSRKQKSNNFGNLVQTYKSYNAPKDNVAAFPFLLV